MKHPIKATVFSLALPLVSLVTFYLYGKWHWDLSRALRAEQQTLLSWPLIDGLKIVSVVMAVSGLGVLIAAVFTEKSRLYLVPAVVLNFVACMTIPTIT